MGLLLWSDNERVESRNVEWNEVWNENGDRMNAKFQCFVEHWNQRQYSNGQWKQIVVHNVIYSIYF